MLSIRSAAFAIALGSIVATPALADTVTFKNGREIHGRLIDETKDDVTVQVGTGTLHFKKNDIATFTKDNDYGQGYFIPPKRTGEAGTAADVKTTRQWARPKDATDEDMRKLSLMHKRIEDEYTRTGLSTQERLRKYELTAVERGSLENSIAGLGRTGSGASTTADFASFGLKSIPALSDALVNGEMTSRAAACVALADVVTRGDADDAKWLLGKSKVGARLVTLLDASGDEASALARNAANRTLEQISGTTYHWVDSKEAYPTAPEREATKSWKIWVAADTSTFEVTEKDHADKIKTLDEVWKSLEDPKGWREALEKAIDTYGLPADKPAAGGTTPTPPANTDVNGEIAKTATPEELKQISDAKKKIKDCLEKTVGMSLDELKAKYSLTSEQRQDAQVKLSQLGSDKRRGGGQMRQNAANEVVSYGLGAIEILVGAMDNSPFARWDCAKALGTLSSNNRDDALRLEYAFHGPTGILPLFDEASDERAPTIRMDANHALMAITGTDQGYPDGRTDQAPDQSEVDAAGRWKPVVNKLSSDFANREKLREDHRKKLKDLLQDLDKSSKWREALNATPKEIDATEKDLRS